MIKRFILLLILTTLILPQYSSAVERKPIPKEKNIEKHKDNDKGNGEDKDKNNEKVSFNFVDVELSAIAKFISDITGKNIVFDQDFKGTVTIIAPTALTKDEAFKLFASVLEMKGYTVVSSGANTYKIVQLTVAKRKGVEILPYNTKITNESYMARIVELKYLSTNDAINFLRPLVSKDGYIGDFSTGNLLLIMDSGQNLKNILTLIDQMDRPSEKDQPEIIYLKNASAEQLSKTITDALKEEKGIQKAAQTTPSSSESVKVLADKRLNALIVFGPKTERTSVIKLITMLDSPSPQEQGNINVYFLENADAKELSEVLQKMITQTITSAKKTTAGETQQKQQALFSANSDIFITADEATNSLIIAAPPSDYKTITDVIKKLDRRRKQVFVEAMIIEVSIDGVIELGAKWRAAAEHDGEPRFIGGIGAIDTTAMGQIVSGLSGFSIGGMGNFLDIPITSTNSDGTTSTTTLTAPGYAALFSLSEFKDVVNVLSTPQILTSDNQEAEIIVGENVPFITKREANPTATTSVFSSIERQDVGITLKITPQITEGDYINLDIYQEISQVKDSSENITISVGPTTTKRATKTTVIVKDKQTVAIGGLIEEKQNETIDKIPLLGDIPVLGWLFKSKKDTKDKINLMVFLTPYIINDSEELSAITSIKRQEIRKDYSLSSKLEDNKNKDDNRETIDKDSVEDNNSKQLKKDTPEKDKVENNTISNEHILIVRFANTVARDKAYAILLNAGAYMSNQSGNSALYKAKVKKGKDIDKVIKELEAISEVKYVEKESVIQGFGNKAD
ncbi:general secretion pathway protein D [Candidatus Magnetoovum chiemensis]|nr:general secretion pathway protein D [Candidatus Magnetoovum chiemensis]